MQKQDEGNLNAIISHKPTLKRKKLSWLVLILILVIIFLIFAFIFYNFLNNDPQKKSSFFIFYNLFNFGNRKSNTGNLPPSNPDSSSQSNNSAAGASSDSFQSPNTPSSSQNSNSLTPPDDSNNAPTNFYELLKQNFTGCPAPKSCKDLIYLDCGLKVDGVSYYANSVTGRIISVCGGVCSHPEGYQIEDCKTICQPKEWTCA